MNTSNDAESIPGPDDRHGPKEDATADTNEASGGGRHGLVTILSLLAFLVVLILFLSFLGGAVG